MMFRITDHTEQQASVQDKDSKSQVYHLINNKVQLTNKLQIILLCQVIFKTKKREVLVLEHQEKYTKGFIQKLNLLFKIQICQVLVHMMSSLLQRDLRVITRAVLQEREITMNFVKIYLFNIDIALNYPQHPGPGYYKDSTHMNKTGTYFYSKFTNSGSQRFAKNERIFLQISILKVFIYLFRKFNTRTWLV